ncbi:hypothetical protein BJ170DRAFT_625042 [Xylariales sp. AK1849]|nr:hypothetical protein BJ170DRAFT_625042 [Xylariales sp. AK1849]
MAFCVWYLSFAVVTSAFRMQVNALAGVHSKVPCTILLTVGRLGAKISYFRAEPGVSHATWRWLSACASNSHIPRRVTAERLYRIDNLQRGRAEVPSTRE